MTTTSKATLMDGKSLAARVLEQAAARVEKIRSATGITPALATVLVGDDPGSATYVRMKRKRCETAGMQSVRIEMPQTAGTLGRVALGMPAYGSCTPAGIMTLLAEYNVALMGMEAVVIGRSPILGKPMAAMLLNEHATVTVCHSRTRDLPTVVRRADLVVAAVGKPKFVKGDWIKPGAVVIDAGYNEGNIGDVDFDEAVQVASMITPVPGGVGPMTIATLIAQTAQAAARQLGVELP
jgi:methylenetetrahydrofolate dehydrogenase (NADP+)/methenyltetrahydrofolate cyclohydrolase